jgi:hypothetical protein
MYMDSIGFARLAGAVRRSPWKRGFLLTMKQPGIVWSHYWRGRSPIRDYPTFSVFAENSKVRTGSRRARKGPLKVWAEVAEGPAVLPETIAL